MHVFTLFGLPFTGWTLLPLLCLLLAFATLYPILCTVQFPWTGLPADSILGSSCFMQAESSTPETAQAEPSILGAVEAELSTPETVQAESGSSAIGATQAEPSTPGAAQTGSSAPETTPEEPSTPVPVQEKDSRRRRILEVLRGTESAEAQNLPEDIKGSEIVDALQLLQGAELLEALHTVEVMGQRQQKWEKHSLSPLSLSVLLNYVLQILSANEGRCVIAMYFSFFSTEDRNIEAGSRILGCAKKRAYAALEEFEDSGFSIFRDRINAPGAGRTSTEKVFEKRIFVECTAAGISEEELEARQKKCKVEAELRKLGKQDTVPEQESDPVLLSIEGKELPSAAQTVADARESAGRALNLLKQEQERMQFGSSDFLREASDFIASTSTWLESVVSALEGISEEYRPLLDKSIARTALDFHRMNQSLLEERERLGNELSAYHVAKNLRRVFRLKRCRHHMEEEQDRYIWLTEVLASSHTEEEKKENAPVSCPVQTPNPAHLEEVLNGWEKWDAFLLQMEAQCYRQEISEALKRLQWMKGLYLDAAGRFRKNQEASAAFSILTEAFRSCFRNWTDIQKKDITRYNVAKQISSIILSRGFATELGSLFADYSVSCPPAPNEAAESALGTCSPELPEEDQRKIQEASQKALEAMKSLRNILKASEENRKTRKNAAEDAPIADASAVLEEAEEQCRNAASCTRAHPALYPTFLLVSGALQAMAQKWLDKWGNNGSTAKYTIARMVCNSILATKTKKALSRIFASFSTARQAAEESVDEFVAFDMPVEEGRNSRLSPEKRMELIHSFWEEGKDPTSIFVWLDYIIGRECSRNYGDPCGTFKGCSMTRNELKNAFACLTGIEFSAPTLWNLVKTKMGYSSRQCAKLDQIGEAHPLRNEQYQHITANVEEALKSGRILVVSLDTKATVVLGRLKHDNGMLLSSPDGTIYRVYDHDFPFTMKDIYTNGTNLVDESRMNERAVLRPVGVYCKNDNTGYVSLVLGKDTAESMRNILRKVVEIKRASMPELESVLVLADGGGANMSNGIQWTEQLLMLADETRIPFHVCHFAPGTSRHNPIEHALWSYVSIHWKGKPFLDIEHVARYISETTTCPKNRTGLQVTCWFDRKHYMTNTEKKAAGIQVLTRKQLEQKAGDRIKHTFEQGTDMYKWNYTVYPSEAVLKAA